MGHTSIEEVRKSVKTYLLIFFTLMFLTIVTVGVSYVHLPLYSAVTVALLVAGVKASLVGLFFMHLNHEKPIIYWTLGGTGFFFLVVMAISFFL